MAACLHGFMVLYLLTLLCAQTMSCIQPMCYGLSRAGFYAGQHFRIFGVMSASVSDECSDHYQQPFLSLLQLREVVTIIIAFLIDDSGNSLERWKITGNLIITILTLLL